MRAKHAEVSRLRRIARWGFLVTLCTQLTGLWTLHRFNEPAGLAVILTGFIPLAVQLRFAISAERLAKEVNIGRRCGGCGELRLPNQPYCPECGLREPPVAR